MREGCLKPERVLVIRWSALGDVVMALPVAATLKASGAEAVGWMIDSRFVELVDRQPKIDRYFPFDRSRFRKKWVLPWRWREQFLAYARTRQLNAAIAFDLQGHSKTALALKLSGAKRRVILNPKDKLARTFATDVFFSRPEQHLVDAYLDTIEYHGFASRTIQFDLSKEDQIETPREYATFHLGSTHPKKQWPIDRFIEVARHVELPIVLVGGQSEAASRDAFLSSVSSVTDAVGKVSIRGLAAILSRSRVHISGDTGTAHVAAAFGAPCVTVFGHMPAKVYHPYNQPEACIEAEGGIRDISVEMVVNKLHERMQERFS